MRWHRRLGPWPLYLLARARRADHGRLRAAAHDGVLHQFGQLLWTYPGHPRRDRRLVAAVRGRHHLLPARAPADGLRDLVVGAPLHLPRAVPVVLAPGRHRRVVRRAPVGARRGGRRCGSGRSRVVVAARIGLPLWRSLRHRVRVVGVDAGGPGHRLGRAARPPAATGCRSPAASSSSGASCAAGCGGRRTRTRSRRRRRGDRLRITVKDLGDHSAGARAAAARHAGGDRRARTAPSPPTRAERDRLLLVGAGVGTAPILALLQELPAATPTSSSCCAAPRREDLVLRDEIADEVARAAAAGCVELVGSRERGAPRRRRAAPRSSPTCADRDVYLCGPDALHARLAAELAARRRARAPHPLRILRLLRRSPRCAEPRSSSPPPSPAPPASWPSTPHAPARPDRDRVRRDDTPRRRRERDDAPRSATAHGIGELAAPPPATRSTPSTATPRSASPSQAARSPRSRRCSCRATTRSSVQISSYAEPRPAARARWPSRPPPSTPSAAPPSPAPATRQSLQSALDKLGFKAADGSRATLQVP